MAANTVKNSAPLFGGTDEGKALFASAEGSTKIVELDPKILAQVTDLLSKVGYVQGMTFHEATDNETKVANDKRLSVAKAQGNEPKPPKTIVDMAVAKARAEANTIKPYAERATDTAEEGSSLFGKSTTVRFSNQGTDEAPRVLWGIVVVNKRNRAAKEDAPATEAPTTDSK